MKPVGRAGGLLLMWDPKRVYLRVYEDNEIFMLS